MMVDMAEELKTSKLPRKIITTSFWPGSVMTETISEILQKNQNETDKTKKSESITELTKAFTLAEESPRYSGRCLAKIIAVSKTSKKFQDSINGKVVFSSDIGQELGVR